VLVALVLVALAVTVIWPGHVVALDTEVAP